MNGSFGIILKDNSVLLVRRTDYPIWVLPGGGVESGETSEKAVIREIFEETGFNSRIVKKIGAYHYKNPSKVNTLFLCEITGGVQTLSSESGDIQYFPLSKLPDTTHPNVKVFVADLLSNYDHPVERVLKSIDARTLLHFLPRHPQIVIRFILFKSFRKLKRLTCLNH